MIEVICAHCGKPTMKRRADINRAAKRGAPLYCGKVCFGLAHRRAVPLTEAEAKERKRLYDIEYRNREAEKLRIKKAAYYQRTHDPVREAIQRKKRMPKHVEYCRRPEYVAYKREYDREYRAKQDFGEF